MMDKSKISKRDYQLLRKKYNNLDPILKKIDEGYPIQYLIGNVDFYGYDIEVNPNVLIPRFETESLVLKTLEYIKKLDLRESSVLEIGTGSGCISIALKGEIDTLEVTAIDVSRKALFLARKNAKRNDVDINFIYKDLFKYDLINNYDVLISNPPYISPGDEVSDNTKYEPYGAIYVEGNPLKYYDEILKISLKALNKKNLIAFEIDEEQGKNMVKLAKKYYPKGKIILDQDLTNKDRFLFIINE